MRIFCFFFSVKEQRVILYPSHKALPVSVSSLLLSCLFKDVVAEYSVSVQPFI